MLQKEGLWIRNQMHSLATCVHRFHMLPKEVSQGYACQGFWGFFCGFGSVGLYYQFYSLVFQSPFVLPPSRSLTICSRDFLAWINYTCRCYLLRGICARNELAEKVPWTHSNSSLLIDIWLQCVSVSVFVFACKPCKSMRQERWTNKESEKNVWRHMRGGE